VKTRITELLGIEHPIFQAAMSWASSNAPLIMASRPPMWWSTRS